MSPQLPSVEPDAAEAARTPEHIRRAADWAANWRAHIDRQAADLGIPREWFPEPAEFISELAA